MSRLTDAQWEKIEHLFVLKQGRGVGRPAANPREVLDAIRWVHAHEERWLHLPSEFPSQQTCYIKLLEWRKDGRLERAEQLLSDKQRPQVAGP